MRLIFSFFSASATFAHAHQAIDNYGLFASVAQRGQHATPTTSSRSCHSLALDASRYSYKASSSAFMEKVQEKIMADVFIYTLMGSSVLTSIVSTYYSIVGLW